MPQKNSFYVTALGMSIDRSERFTRGRRGRPTNSRKIEELVFANRSEVVASVFDSDSDSEDPETAEENGFDHERK